MDKQQKVYGVTEVNLLIKDLLEQTPALRDILVRGEISNYKVYPSGHHYFSLKDPEGAIRCVMFRGAATTLKFRPENGMKVIVAGRVSAYPRDGAYQLYCSHISPDGIGDLYVAFEQLKEKLNQEGLFDSSHKKPLPPYPHTIAIITSSAGAAVHDMIRILRRRYPISNVKLLPVRVQGTEAPAEIAGAIRYANRWHIGDVLIVGRGGGSIEDLWAFNDERVARAIYASEIPVISAVGHEPDVTISDFVADRRASTPSNAAEIAVPDQADLLRFLSAADARMSQAELGMLKKYSDRVEALKTRRSLTDPSAFLQDRRQRLDFVQQRLGTAMRGEISAQQQKFGKLTAALDAMSPLKVLGRGYAMAQSRNGTVLKDAAQVNTGDTVFVRLGKGSLTCAVEKKEE
jgi:exodeoxyribonuclease VII large subunit